MSTLCLYTKNGSKCSNPATHSVNANMLECSHWKISNKPKQLETLSGFKLSDPDLDERGRQKVDADNKPLPRIPRMQTVEFCLSHAEMVCEVRNAQQLQAV